TSNATEKLVGFRQGDDTRGLSGGACEGRSGAYSRGGYIPNFDDRLARTVPDRVLAKLRRFQRIRHRTERDEERIPQGSCAHRFWQFREDLGHSCYATGAKGGPQAALTGRSDLRAGPEAKQAQGLRRALGCRREGLCAGRGGVPAREKARPSGAVLQQ